MNNMVIFGAPGAGKGTHASILAERYDLYHLSTGDRLRQEVASGSPLGKEIQAIMNRGELVDDDTVTKIVNKAIIEDPRGIIFDGFPRTVRQAVVLDLLLQIYHQRLNCVVRIDVPRDELVRRIHERAVISGRHDDTDDAIINRRLDEYENKTFPVIDYYRQNGVLLTVDAAGSIEETRDRIAAAVAGKMTVPMK